MSDRADAEIEEARRDLEDLRKAVRAFAKVAPLPKVTPKAIRRVLKARGWERVGTVPWPGEPDRVAFECYDNPKAKGTNRFGSVPAVLVPVAEDSGDFRNRVGEWAEAVATRTGGEAPAEVLAEVLAEVRGR